jgi:hypothetical protein
MDFTNNFGGAMSSAKLCQLKQIGGQLHASHLCFHLKLALGALCEPKFANGIALI